MLLSDEVCDRCGLAWEECACEDEDDRCPDCGELWDECECGDLPDEATRWAGRAFMSGGEDGRDGRPSGIRGAREGQT